MTLSAIVCLGYYFYQMLPKSDPVTENYMNKLSDDWHQKFVRGSQVSDLQNLDNLPTPFLN